MRNQDTYIPAAPLLPAPRQPIRSHDRGDKVIRKPTIALHDQLAWRDLETARHELTPG